MHTRDECRHVSIIFSQHNYIPLQNSILGITDTMLDITENCCFEMNFDRVTILQLTSFAESIMFPHDMTKKIAWRLESLLRY